jgi:ABC-type transport system involved in cytochrome c biogenesis permease subunit
MRDSSTLWLRIAACLFIPGVVQALLTLFRRNERSFGPAFAAFTVGAVLEMVAITERGFAENRLPLNNFFESMAVCALLIAAAFLFVYWRYQFQSLGIFIFPLVFVMTLIAGFEQPVGPWTSAGVRGAWLAVHVLLILTGYAALLVTALASVFYLVQERQLKYKRPGKWFERLPALGTLDTIITRAMAVGFVFITLGVVTASSWAYVELGTRWVGQTQIAFSFLTWGFYLVMVFLRNSAGWRGRKAAYMALTVLCCSALTWVAHVGLRPVVTR